MPEGHTVHRTANQFNRAFKGQRLRVDSPQGRFAAGAGVLDQQRFIGARAIGKQLFLAFDGGLELRIHLGIYGKWAWHNLTADDFGNIDLPAVRGEVRARFWLEPNDPTAGAVLAELRGPTVCEVLASHEIQKVERRLGPDPLNPDPGGAEFERFAGNVSKSAKSIALLLMDQSVISGIGNVYRAEILFRAGINPHTPGRALSGEQVRELWLDSVELLKVGVRAGVMITRDEYLKRDPGKSERNHVYKREGQACRVCGATIAIELLAGRKLYWCPGCQR